MPRQPQTGPRSGHSFFCRFSFLGASALAITLVSAFGCTDPFSGGDDVSGAARVGQWEAQGGDVVRGRESDLLNGTPKKQRTIAAMMFDISGGAPNQTNIQNLIMGTGKSLRHMYNEVSYGLQDITADLYGPYKLPVANCLTIACCGPSSDKTGNGSTVQGLIDALPKKYDHYFWVYGGIPNGADCGTWGDEGSSNKPAVYSSYSFHEITGYSQELGHNFGMTHEATMTCSGQKPILDDPSQCTHVEYGSLISFMGQGSSAAYHPSAYHKFQQGWISKCNAVKVGSAGGMYRLVPQELPCDGVQYLQVPAPKSRSAPSGGRGTLNTYYLEMRATYGFDTIKPQVIISIGGALPNMTSAAPYLYMLDMTPESGSRVHTNAGLMTVGQSFVDPAGSLTFTLASIDNNSATVMITGATGTGSDTCSDSTPFTGPGPDGTSCGPLSGGPADGGVTPPTDSGTGAGTGGRAGTGGASGTGGRGGSGGAGTSTGGRVGTGGSTSGSGGSSNSGGAPGSGGAPVTGSGGAPVTGSGGAPVTGSGGAPVTGSGGAPVTGSGGMSGGGTATGGAGPGINDPVGGGCACNTGGTGSGAMSISWFSTLSVGLAALLMGRRRSSRRNRR